MDMLGPLLDGLVFTLTSIIQVTWPFLLVAIIWRVIQAR